jgi:hypothetical protein
MLLGSWENVNKGMLISHTMGNVYSEISFVAAAKVESSEFQLSNFRGSGQALPS